MHQVLRLPLRFFAAMLLLTALAYLPGLGGPFVFDDHPNLVLNEAVQLKALNWDALAGAMRSYGAENWNRALSMLTFALNYYVSGLEPLSFKIVNLALHLTNGALLYLLARLLLTALVRFRNLPISPTQVEWAAALGAAFWLIHPINLTTVLYIVQRMNLLSATFSLLGMLFYLWGRLRLAEGRSPGWAALGGGVAVFTLLSFFAKENGILLPLQLLLVEWIVFGFAGIRRDRLRLLGWVGAGLAVAALAMLPALLQGVMNGYDIRNFDMTQRLFTEARALWFYLGMLAIPQPAQFGLFHDDMAISKGLLDPWTTLPALMGLALLLALALWGHRRAPVPAFGILFFLLGHSLESSILPLELVHEHRNYLPGIGILLSLAYGFVRLSGLVRRRVLLLAPAAFLAMCGTAIFIRALDWRDPVELALSEVYYHPNSSRANYQLGQLYTLAMEADPSNADRYEAMALERLLAAARLDPSMAGGILVGYTLMEAKAGRKLAPEMQNEIEEALERDPPAVLASTNLVQLFECVQQKLCTLAYDDLVRLMEAFDRNPKVWGAVRAKVYAASLEVSLGQGDWERVLHYSEAAVKQDSGNVQHWLNRAAILLAVGDPDPARAALDRARALDRYGAFREKIAGIERTMGVDQPAATKP